MKEMKGFFKKYKCRLTGTCISCSKWDADVMQLPGIIPELPNLNTTAFSLSPPTERGHCVHSLSDVSGRARRWRTDGGHQGISGQAGRGVGVGSHGRGHLAQILSQAHECHREVTQGHPGAGGHRKVIREGEIANR